MSNDPSPLGGEVARAARAFSANSSVQQALAGLSADSGVKAAAMKIAKAATGNGDFQRQIADLKRVTDQMTLAPTVDVHAITVGISDAERERRRSPIETRDAMVQMNHQLEEQLGLVTEQLGLILTTTERRDRWMIGLTAAVVVVAVLTLIVIVALA
jgi:hypothetical protein